MAAPLSHDVRIIPMKLNVPRQYRRLLFLPPVLIAAWLAYQVAHREPPERVEALEVSRTLRVLRVPEAAAMPRAIGYGVAEPGRTWRAIAEVKGRIVEIHPELQSGAFAEAGELLVRLDSTDYELNVAQLEAGIAQLSARLDEIEAREANLHETLEIEQRSLELSRAELVRLEKLAEDDQVSESTLDQERRTVLAQEKAVVSVESSLRLIPAERSAARAELDAKEVALQSARRELERTELVAPFDCRLSEVNAELDQFVAAGEVLAEAQSLATTEVEAQFSTERMRNFVADMHSNWTESSSVRDPEFLNQVRAIVRFDAGELTASWEARVLRIREHLDPATRTIGVVVEVAQPYEKAVPGIRPPLLKGMFCEVELRREAARTYPVIPRLALHADRLEWFVYVRDGEGRLDRRGVDLAFRAGGFAAVAGGLGPGEELIISDPTPAVLGMSVDPVEDPAALARLLEEATGDGLLR